MRRNDGAMMHACASSAGAPPIQPWRCESIATNEPDTAWYRQICHLWLYGPRLTGPKDRMVSAPVERFRRNDTGVTFSMAHIGRTPSAIRMDRIRGAATRKSKQ